jgi:hypothetical protein
MRKKEIKKEERKQLIVHNEKEFRSNENSNGRKIIRLINNANSTTQVKKSSYQAGR